MSTVSAPAVVDAILAEVAFAAPVSFEDCVVVHGAIAVQLTGYSVEVYHRHVDVVVTVWRDGKRLVRRVIDVAA